MAPEPTKDSREPDWPKGLYRRNRCWSFRRQVRGTKYRISLGEISAREAFDLAEEYNAKLAAGVDLEQQIRRRATLVADFVPKFLAMKKSEVSAGTVDRYRSVFDNFLYWLNERHPKATFDAITSETAQEYLVARKAGPVIPNGVRPNTRPMKGDSSPWTIRTERDYLRALFREAKKRGLIRDNPFVGQYVRKPTREQVRAAHRILAPHEADALLKAAGEVDRASQEHGNPSAKLQGERECGRGP